MIQSSYTSCFTLVIAARLIHCAVTYAFLRMIKSTIRSLLRSGLLHTEALPSGVFAESTIDRSSSHGDERISMTHLSLVLNSCLFHHLRSSSSVPIFPQRTQLNLAIQESRAMVTHLRSSTMKMKAQDLCCLRLQIDEQLSHLTPSVSCSSAAPLPTGTTKS